MANWKSGQSYFDALWSFRCKDVALLGGAWHQVLRRSPLLELLMRPFFRVVTLIADFEGRRVFRPILAPIVQAGGRDVGVT